MSRPFVYAVQFIYNVCLPKKWQRTVKATSLYIYKNIWRLPACCEIVVAFLLPSLQKWQQEQHSGTKIARIVTIRPKTPNSESCNDRHITHCVPMYKTQYTLCVGIAVNVFNTWNLINVEIYMHLPLVFGSSSLHKTNRIHWFPKTAFFGSNGPTSKETLKDHLRNSYSRAADP